MLLAAELQRPVESPVVGGLIRSQLNPANQDVQQVNQHAIQSRLTPRLNLAADRAQDDRGSALVANRQVVFVDGNIDDYQSLIDSIGFGDSVAASVSDARQFEIVLIDRVRDGIDQISDYLFPGGEDNFVPINSLHILSHGSTASLQLGNAQLDDRSLGERQQNCEDGKTPCLLMPTSSCMDATSPTDSGESSLLIRSRCSPAPMWRHPTI